MTKNEDKLLKEFFDSQRQEIKDNGFTHRVMRNLPVHKKWLAQLWSTVFIVIGVLLFFALNGLELVLGAFKEGFTAALQNGAEYIDLPTIVIIVAVCIGLIVQKINSYSF